MLTTNSFFCNVTKNYSSLSLCDTMSLIGLELNWTELCEQLEYSDTLESEWDLICMAQSWVGPSSRRFDLRHGNSGSIA